MIHGVLPIDKPQGWTSHDVVARVRRLAGQKGVGHAGTLDPLATGVLLLVLGRATRLSSHLMASAKTYCADVVLGASTVTDDAEAPAEMLTEVRSISSVELERCLEQFVGDIDQIPPSYASVRHEGQKLYALARRGVEIEKKPRRVSIHAIKLERWNSPCMRLRVQCGSGTYIRSLARDIGLSLGTGAYLHALRRVASGAISVGYCCRMDDLSDAADVRAATLPADCAVVDLPAQVLDAHDVHHIRAGRPISMSSIANVSALRLYDASGTLVALARQTGQLVRPFRVFDGGREPDARGH